MPKSRRSKSLSKSDKVSMSASRTSSSSPYQDKENGSRSSTTEAPSATPSGSRTSLDRARSVKKFMTTTSRLSSDTSHTSLQRSESILSEETQQTWEAYNQEPLFDDVSTPNLTADDLHSDRCPL